MAIQQKLKIQLTKKRTMPFTLHFCQIVIVARFMRIKKQPKKPPKQMAKTDNDGLKWTNEKKEKAM